MYYKFAVILLFLISTHLIPQTNWQKHTLNPVLQTGNPGFWDVTMVFAPSVINEGNTYKMYYAGFDGINFTIGLATSSDKINWEKFQSFPLIYEGSPGSWDGLYVTQPSVIFQDRIYKMWYTGWASGGIENLKIGYAISSNGVSWDKYDFNPVLTASTIGNWDPLGVYSPSVIHHNGTYYMWFTGNNGTGTAIGVVTSVDGINWNWYQINPVLEGNSESWDKNVAHCKVLYAGNKFHMWYTGFDGDTARIGYATSLTGVDWEKSMDNPVLDRGTNSWELRAVDEPDVIFDEDILHMWYSGFENINHSQIGYATSDFTVNVENEEQLPDGFSLFQNYPNPFNPTTNIKFTIPSVETGHAPSLHTTLIIYDVLGNEVATLVNEDKPAGNYQVEFNATGLPSGIYFYQLSAGKFIKTKKMVLMR